MRHTIDQNELSKFLSLFIDDDYKLIYDDLSDHQKTLQPDTSKPIVIVNPLLSNDKHLYNADYIVTFGQKIDIEGYHSYKFSFTLSSERTLEYIFPWGQKKIFSIKKKTKKHIGSFLKNTIRYFLAFSGFQKMLVYQLLVYSKKAIWFDALPKSLSCNSYLIDFTKNNQLLLEINQDYSKNYLIKIPIDQISKQLSINESGILSFLSRYQFRNLKYPRSGTTDNGFLLIENIIPKKSTRPYYLENTHLNCLDELFHTGNKTETIENLPFWKAIQERMILLDPALPHKFWFDLYNSLLELNKTIPSQTSIPVSLAHGNFWQNEIFKKGEVIYTQSWENAFKQAPLLFDAFHFIFYSESLGKNTSFNVINEELTRLKNQKLVKRYILEENLNFELHLKLYILYQASYFMQELMNYPLKIKTDNLLLLENWLKAVFTLSGGKKSISDRQVFLINFFSDPFSKTYVLLGYTQSSILKIAEWTDLDILVPRSNFPDIIQFVKSQGSIRKLRLTKKFNKNIIELFFYDGTYQRVNFIFNFYTKGYNYLLSEQVFKHASRNHENIWLARTTDSFEYLCLPLLLKKKNLEPALIKYFTSLEKKLQNEIVHDLQEKYELPIKSLEELYYHNELIFEHLSNYFKRTGKKKFDPKFKTHYFFYSFRKKYPCNGLIISFSGPEGSGKSTVIQQFSKIIAQKYNRKFIILPQGPSLIPNLHKLKKRKSEEEILGYKPLRKNISNQSVIKSFLRFFNHYADYLLGQIYIWFKYEAKGYIVIYDRYYFDFIADQKYCNIKLNKKIITRLYKLVKKPALNIFLYAPPEQLANRTDTNCSDFEKLTLNYIDLFHTLSSKYKKSRYFSVENQELNASLEIIEKEFGKVV